MTLFIGWNNLEDVENNFNTSTSNKTFFLVLKREDNIANMTGLLVFRINTYYGFVVRDYNIEYDTKASFFPDYMTKNDLIGWFKSDSAYMYLYSLTEEEKEIFFNSLEND